MAGLEVLYRATLGDIATSQDALVCFVHWELVRAGYGCLGAGDEPGTNEKKSEMLPADWNKSRELYTLRYQSNDETNVLLKAILVDSTVIFNMMNFKTNQVSDLIVNLTEHVDDDHLQDFGRVFKDPDNLRQMIKSSFVSPPVHTGNSKKNKPEKSANVPYEADPLRIPDRNPRSDRHPAWPDPMGPFAVGGSDLDPFGGRQGGMIFDPLRSGLPRPGFNPTSGIPGRLPPGAVPPGARFDPFGPVGRNPPGPDPDHMPPPGFDDMFM
ncbi:proteasome inhibitor PI31 subunit [Erpetoichthys calabaricus]|uniref:Proteasome inhibitor PI31 subunit n=1 Tax=Erpetoichthys calabaricus TaxID=27687 RepID=A0A8C4SCB5_ERPCA|nr:proteasome inhibitor PI31 subunit [Erpetoichthys calabaricus]